MPTPQRKKKVTKAKQIVKANGSYITHAMYKKITQSERVRDFRRLKEIINEAYFIIKSYGK